MTASTMSAIVDELAPRACATCIGRARPPAWPPRTGCRRRCPGCIAFTRIGASSRASVLSRPSMPPLMVETVVEPGYGASFARPPNSTIPVSFDGIETVEQRVHHLGVADQLEGDESAWREHVVVANRVRVAIDRARGPGRAPRPLRRVLAGDALGLGQVERDGGRSLAERIGDLPACGSSSRPEITTRSPRATTSFAISRPMPEVPPITTIVRSLIAAPLRVVPRGRSNRGRSGMRGGRASAGTASRASARARRRPRTSARTRPAPRRRRRARSRKPCPSNVASTSPSRIR